MANPPSGPDLTSSELQSMALVEELGPLGDLSAIGILDHVIRVSHMAHNLYTAGQLDEKDLSYFLDQLLRGI